MSRASSFCWGSDLPIRMLPFAAISFIFLLQFRLSLASTSLNQASDAIIFQTKDGRQQREFDYFKLALQWPGTICKGTRHCCSSNACCNRWVALLFFLPYPPFRMLNDCYLLKFFSIYSCCLMWKSGRSYIVCVLCIIEPSAFFRPNYWMILLADRKSKRK